MEPAITEQVYVFVFIWKISRSNVFQIYSFPLPFSLKIFYKRSCRSNLVVKKNHLKYYSLFFSREGKYWSARSSNATTYGYCTDFVSENIQGGWFRNWKGAKCNAKPSVIAVNEIMKYICCSIVRTKFISGKVIGYFLRVGAEVPSKSCQIIYEYRLQTNIC